MFFKAKMAQTYGWSHEYINEMDCSIAREYYQAITVIEAQQALVQMNITDYPRMKKDSRKKFYREMRKQAYPIEMQKLMDFDDFIRTVSDG